MSGDLSIIYYTCNRIAPRFAKAVRSELVRSVGGRFPIICVSHQCVDFGDVRLVVGDVPQSIYRVYQNILFGCHAAETPFVGFAEDDSLYVPGHWDHRPARDTFAYNENRLVITRNLSADGKRREARYYFRPRTQMAQGICSRELMIETLTEKFAKYQLPPISTDAAKKAGWGEPGRYEKNLKLKPRKLERFKWTAQPNVTWNHSDSLMGRRAEHDDDSKFQSVEPWGEANALWNRIHG